MHKLHVVALVLFAICTFSLSVGAQSNDPLEGLGLRPLRTIGWQGEQALKSDDLAPAAAFTPGDVVVCRVGDGTSVLGNSSVPVFLDEYTTAGALVQSVPLPTTSSGSNQMLTASGTATTECQINRSSDGRFLTVTGYAAPPGIVSVATSNTTTFVRVIGRIDASATINTSTTTTSFSGVSPRSAVSDSGNNIWIVGANTGVALMTLGGSGAATVVSSTATNLRTVSIFGGQLYISSAAGTIRVGSVGSGLPTTVGQTITALPGTPTTGNFDAFFLADLNAGVPGVDTLFVADDSGNIRKFSLVGGTWTPNGTVALSAVAGLTGMVTGSTVTLFVTTPGTLQTLTDTSGYNGSINGVLTSIATPASTSAMAFRGVALVPVAPTITTNLTGFNGSFGNVLTGGTSAEQVYTVSGTNIGAGGIVVTAPSGFEVSPLSGVGFSPSFTIGGTGTIAPVQVFVHFKPGTPGPFSGNITQTATGATTVNVPVSGTGTSPGTVQLSSAAFSVNEGGGSASLTVNRTGGTGGPVAVNYSLTNGTATGGTCGGGADFDNTTTQIVFNDGDASKTISVPVCDDSLAEGDETFNITLTSATNGGSIGAQSTATVTINDNDANYSVSTTGGAIVVNDNSGNSDTLTMFEPSAGQIEFTAIGRTFSVDGGPVLAVNSGVISLAGVSSITLNGNAGNDVMSISAFTSLLPSLTINGGKGDDSVQLAGNLAFQSNANLDIDLQNDDPTPGIDQVVIFNGKAITLSGSGSATIRTSQSVVFNLGSSMSVVNGNMTVEANQQAVPTAGNFIGIRVSGAALSTSGTGNIDLKGNGGADAATGNHRGILISQGATVSSVFGAGAGKITLNGNGGQGTNGNWGVGIQDPGTVVSSVVGDIAVTGHGGAGTTTQNFGVHVIGGSQVRSTGPAKITFDGTGGTGSNSSTGTRIVLDDTSVTSTGGDISITGHGGTSPNAIGVSIAFGSLISASGGPKITIDGTGGSGSGGGLTGVVISLRGSQPTPVPTTITSDSGDISINGVGGNGSGLGSGNIGINTDSGARIVATGAAAVTMNGTGGSGASDCYGVGFEAGGVGGTALSAVNGNILVIGAGGTSPGTDMDGVRFEDSSGTPVLPVAMTTTGNGLQTLNGTAGNGDPTSAGIDFVNWASLTSTGPFTAFISDTMDIGTDNVSIDVGTNTLTLVGKSPGRQITLGGADTATELGLTDAELDRVTAGNLFIGDTTSGPVITLADITRPFATNMTIVSAANIDINGGLINSSGGDVNFRPGTNVFPFKSSADVITGTGFTRLAGGKALQLVFTGTTPDSQFTQLNVQGQVDLNNATLALGSVGFTPITGQTFIIVDNDGADPVVGTFAGLPEGGVIPNFLGSGLDAKITYVGNDGNDVMLTVQPPPDTIPPDTAILTHPTDPSSSSSASFTFNGTDTGGSGVAGFECSLDGVAFTSCTSPQSYTGLADGLHTFRVLSVDGAGNVDPTPASFTWTISSVTPVVQFAASAFSGPESLVATVTVTRTGTDLSSTSTIDYATVAGGTATSGTCGTGDADFQPASGSIVFNSGETTKTFNITVCGDLLSENPAETVALMLSNPTGATIGLQGTATLNILDAATEFENLTPISSGIGGQGNPFPSTINISGQPTSIGGIRLTLFSISRSPSFNLEVLLIGPNGQTFVAMTGVGGTNSMNETTITLEDTASNFMPQTSSVTNGQNYKPTDCGLTAGFGPPAPPLPYNEPACTASFSKLGSLGPATFGSTFARSNPNGIWSLYIEDASLLDLHSLDGGNLIRGWGIQFLSPTAAPAGISGQVRTANGPGIRNAVVTVSGGNLQQPITTTTGSFGYFSVNGLTAGRAYVVSVSARHYAFAQPVRIANLLDDVAGFDFVADR